MFNKFWNSLKDDCGLIEMTCVMADIISLTETLEEDYFKDKDARNAAIDAICEILQQHKDA